MFIPYVVLRAGGESQAVQFLAIIPGGLAGESPAVQGLANICRDSRVVFKNLKPFRFQIFKHYPTFLLRGLAPAPPVSLATPRGQGSPLRFDTQPTGWSVGSATRHQGGIRKDCSAALLNLYKASPLTPFRFPESPTVQVSAVVPGRAGGESQAVQSLAVVPGELAGESQAVQGLAVVPGELPGESQAVQVLAVVPRELPGESQAVQVLAVVAETHDGLTTP